MNPPMEIGESSTQASVTGVLASGPLGDIIDRSDVFTVARMSRGAPEVREAIRDHSGLPFGLPSLLHCETPQESFDVRDSPIFVD